MGVMSPPPAGGSDVMIGGVFVGATNDVPAGVEVTSGETGEGTACCVPGFTQALHNAITLRVTNPSRLFRHTKASPSCRSCAI
jgi:hypothetical protein